MPSTILSDNGVSSGTSGIKTTGSNDGALALQTTTAGGTATTALSIDTSQNVGIGTASPSSKLHVVGTSLTNTFRVTDGSNYTMCFGYLGSGNVGLISTLGGSASLAFGTDSTERMRVLANGTIQTVSTISVGNATPSTSGAGITFPATQSASSDANTLDDYEEGTFTPTLFGTTVTGTTTYTEQSGWYTKVGRQVTITIGVACSAMTGTGNLAIGGIPFSSGASFAVSPLMTDSLNWGGGTYLVGYLAGSSSSLRVFYCTDDAGWANQQCVNETQTLYLTMTYFV